jgi:hypothetical protein
VLSHWSSAIRAFLAGSTWAQTVAESIRGNDPRCSTRVPVEATYHPRRPRVGPRHEAVLSRLSFTFALHSPILIPCFTRLQSGFGIT